MLCKELRLRIAFLVDCDSTTGWGHYIRCQSLARDFQMAGAEVAFFVNGVPPDLSEVPCRVTGMPISQTKAARKLAQRLARTHDVVVFDLYDYAKAALNGFIGSALLVCISDGEYPGFHPDILVNPNITATPVVPTEAATDSAMATVTEFYGADYILLRSQFDEADIKICEDVPKRVLVALGGASLTGLPVRVCRALRAARPRFESITILAGGQNWKGSEVQSQMDARFQVLESVNHIYPYYRAADIGLFAAGTMLYEACVAGLPSLTLGLNLSQAREAEAIASREAAHYLGRAEEITSERALSKLQLLMDRQERQKISQNAQRLIDGAGRRRVCHAICEKYKRSFQL